MELVATYSKQKLYDAGADIKRIVKEVSGKFPEVIFRIQEHPAYIEVRCSDKSFPWLFWPELNKAAKLWCTKQDSPEPLFAATTIEDNVCYINRHVLLPQLP